MWIIIEGATCSGKSTLERELSKQLQRLGTHLTKVHMERPAELTRRWTLTEYVLKWETPPAGNILADRWHWGEATYAPIYRPDTDKDGFGLLGVAGWRWVELFLMSRGALTVLLRADQEILKQRFKARGDDHVTNVDELIEVAQLYDSTFTQAPSNSLTYDTSMPSLMKTEGFTRMVIKAAEALEEHVTLISKHEGYIGRPQPSALLVGDERNVTKKYGDETKLPFMPVNGNSGDYLLRALPDDLWPNVGIVNAGEHPQSLKTLWEDLNQPPVVALGNRATEALKRQEVPHTTVQHPQYVRRFTHDKIEMYGERIRAAAQRQES